MKRALEGRSVRPGSNRSLSESETCGAKTLSTVGSLSEFVERECDWIEYIERLEHFFLANDIAEEGKKRLILLSVCWAKTYRLICNLAKPGNIGFEELVTLVQNHLNPKPSVIIQRFKFHTHSRKAGVSVAESMAELRQLSEYCKFGSVLDWAARQYKIGSALRPPFVFNAHRIQQKREEGPGVPFSHIIDNRDRNHVPYMELLSRASGEASQGYLVEMGNFNISPDQHQVCCDSIGPWIPVETILRPGERSSILFKSFLGIEGGSQVRLCGCNSSPVQEVQCWGSPRTGRPLSGER
ncbi:hypothetical protein F2P81_011899 [Scophthalmus maximus]|uniref:Uncharacterized protein n=1 Tax=Scophthalmus maximus TaxID=52904 RepID=A0A6A4ST32_SCOMX|nr:hypothetical protein F2P81_011899 [Scophthalmus maximus]